MKAINRFFSALGPDTAPFLASVLAIIVLVSIFATEASAQSTGTIYGAQQAQRLQQVTPGLVVSIREVAIESTVKDRAFGATTGGILSGAVMNRLARNGAAAERNAAMLLAATVGAYSGNAVAERMAITQAHEIIVEANVNGRVSHFAVVQPEPGPYLSVGQPVFVLSEGGRHRVIPNNTRPNAFGYSDQPQY